VEVVPASSHREASALAPYVNLGAAGGRGEDGGQLRQYGQAGAGGGRPVPDRSASFLDRPLHALTSWPIGWP
ncbi:hypothetical protein ACWDY6_33710, partial [Streptomyces flavidovirens]